MTGDEVRILELFRSCDDRGKRFLLVIAEAEAKHAQEGPYSPYYKALTPSGHNFTIEEGKRP